MFHSGRISPQEAERTRNTIWNQKPNVDEMTERAAFLIEETARQIEDKRKELVKAMRYMGQDLTDEANRLDKNPDTHINSLGVIQGRGVEIDRMVGVYSALLSQAKYLRPMMHIINGTCDPTMTPNSSRVQGKREAKQICADCGLPFGEGAEITRTFGVNGNLHLACAMKRWTKEQPCLHCQKPIGEEKWFEKAERGFVHVSCETAAVGGIDEAL